MNILKYNLIILLLFMSNQVVAIEGCLSIPAGWQDADVKFCETDDEYIFRIAGTTYAYNQEAYRHRLWFEVFKFFWKHQLSWRCFLQSSLKVWLSVPEINPHGVQGRYLLQCQDKSLIFYDGIDPNKWSFSAENAGFFPKGVYPEQFGAKVGELLIKTQVGVEDDEVDRFLSQFSGIIEWEREGSQIVVNTRVWQEMETQDTIKSHFDADKYIKSVDTNSFYEWIAHRREVLTFGIEVKADFEK